MLSTSISSMGLNWRTASIFWCLWSKDFLRARRDSAKAESSWLFVCSIDSETQSSNQAIPGYWYRRSATTSRTELRSFPELFLRWENTVYTSQLFFMILFQLQMKFIKGAVLNTCATLRNCLGSTQYSRSPWRVQMRSDFFTRKNSISRKMRYSACQRELFPFYCPRLTPTRRR